MTRPRLKQLPMFLSPELERAVAELPKDLRVVALGLHRRAVDDDRTWLEVLWAATKPAGATLAEVLAGDRHSGPVSARRAVWYEIRQHTCASLLEIARAFGAHHTTVMVAIAKQAELVAAAAAAREAVEQYNAGGSAA